MSENIPRLFGHGSTSSGRSVLDGVPSVTDDSQERRLVLEDRLPSITPIADSKSSEVTIPLFEPLGESEFFSGVEASNVSGIGSDGAACVMEEPRKSGNRRKLVVGLALALMACIAAGATIAWLTATTAPVVNTFTYGDIDLSLTETSVVDGSPTTANSYKMVPGRKIEKDPTVTVGKDSEPCFVYVKLEKGPNPTDFDKFLEYTTVEEWKKLTGVDDVYYRAVTPDGEHDSKLPVLTENKITVKNGVTKAQLESLRDDTTKQPKLTITAYAVQQEGFTGSTDEAINAKAAWDEAKSEFGKVDSSDPGQGDSGQDTQEP